MNKADLEHGKYYEGECRNARVARWNADENCFYHWRAKFGMKFIETIQHPDDENRWDTFVVEEECVACDPPILFPDEREPATGE